MNVSLGSTFEKFVGQLIASGEYQSQSEVIREGLRLLMERQELRAFRLDELRRQIRLGLEQAERGEVAPLNVESIKVNARRRMTAKRGK